LGILSKKKIDQKNFDQKIDQKKFGRKIKYFLPQLELRRK